MLAFLPSLLGEPSFYLAISNLLLIIVTCVLAWKLHKKESITQSIKPCITPCYSSVLNMLAQEQGDWHVQMVLSNELGKILTHNTKSLDLQEETDYSDDDDSEDDNNESENDSGDNNECNEIGE